MCDVLASDIRPPGSYRPVQTGFLNIHSCSQVSGPGRDYKLRQVCLPLHNHVCVCFQFCVLPWLRKPGIHKVLKKIRVILAVKEFLHNLRESDERRIQRVDPESDFLACFRIPTDLPPFSVPDHVVTVLISDLASALLADVDGHIGTF